MRNEEEEGRGPPVDLRRRTKQFGLRIIRLSSSLGGDDTVSVLRRQLLRSGTSVGAQHREACRARSTAEFISKIESATQELDESGYWMELLVESGLVPKERLESLMQEVDELLAIFVASARTAKGGA
jgi:four helix bundle protein